MEQFEMFSGLELQSLVVFVHLLTVRVWALFYSLSC